MGLYTDLSIDLSRRFGKPPQLPLAKHISRPKRVLIFPAQAEGEVLWSLPAIRALRKHYADSLLSLMLDEGRRSLWHFDDEVDEIIDYRPQLLKGRGGAEFKRLKGLIKSRRFDLLLNLNYRDCPLTDYLFYQTVPGIRLNDINTCRLVRAGSVITTSMNGTFIDTETIDPLNQPSVGYAPLIPRAPAPF